MFHLHIGYDNPNVEISLKLIKTFDIFLGIPSVIIDPDTQRRELYGKAGAFRLTRYGVEFRTLSSYMMANDYNLNLMWSLLNIALNHIYIPEHFDEDSVQCIINNSDIIEAKKFLKLLFKDISYFVIPKVVREFIQDKVEL